MKNISEHLGQIIAALAAIALLVACVTGFRAPIGDFFDSILYKQTALGGKVLASMDSFDVSDMNGSGSGDVTPKTYHIIQGAGQTYSAGQLGFTSDAPYDKFAGVKVNGSVVDPVNYTVTEGSTIITFTEAYSQLLANGDYQIEVLATDGVASAPFDVNISVPTDPITEADMVGTFTNGEYEILLDAYGMGKLLVAAHGMENEMFEWELNDNGEIVFDVNWTTRNWTSLLDGHTGVISDDGNTIVVGDLTFTRK